MDKLTQVRAYLLAPCQAAPSPEQKARKDLEFARTRRRSPLRIVADVLREPMLALLLVGGVVYLALKSGGPVVAVTDDGANDTLSLKATHIGAAMGRRDTECCARGGVHRASGR